MVSLTWNVEGGVSGNFSWFFGSFVTLLFIWIIEKVKFIQLK